MKGEVITKEKYPHVYEWLSGNVLIFNKLLNGIYYFSEKYANNFTIHEGKINVKGSIVLDKSISIIKYPFGVIEGDFLCAYCKHLKSLKNCPTHVKGRFDCSECDNLITLKGCPKKIDGDFSCSGCKKLESLKYSPKEVGGEFDCGACNGLTTLKGCNTKILGNFDCRDCMELIKFDTYINVECDDDYSNEFNCGRCKKLESLVGSPEIIGTFYCAGCVSLKDLNCSTMYVNDEFNCTGCENLLSFNGCPREINGSFMFDGCDSVTNFNGMCEDITLNFSCFNCYSLMSLHGMPNVMGDISIQNCGALSSLVGLSCGRFESFYFEDNKFSNNPKEKEAYKLYLAMWIELFESVSNKKRGEYIECYKNKKNDANDFPIIPIEIMREYGF